MLPGVEQRLRLHSERIGEALHGTQAGVAIAPFDGADERPVHAGARRELLLREPPLLPSGAQVPRKGLGQIRHLGDF